MMIVRCGCPISPSIRYLIAFDRTNASKICCGVLDSYLEERKIGIQGDMN